MRNLEGLESVVLALLLATSCTSSPGRGTQADASVAADASRAAPDGLQGTASDSSGGSSGQSGSSVDAASTGLGGQGGTAPGGNGPDGAPREDRGVAGAGGSVDGGTGTGGVGFDANADRGPDRSLDRGPDQSPDQSPDQNLDSRFAEADLARGTGQACGAPTDPPCAPGQFCDLPDNRCGAGVHGVCETAPVSVCSAIERQVCGCDGVVYPSACQANLAGSDVSKAAACAAPTGTFRCGWIYCRRDSEYCSSVEGGAVSFPGTFQCLAMPAACGSSPSCACLSPSSGLCTQSSDGALTVRTLAP